MKLILEINGKRRSLNRLVAAVVLTVSMLAFTELFLEGMDSEYEYHEQEVHEFLSGTKMDPARGIDAR